MSSYSSSEDEMSYEEDEMEIENQREFEEYVQEREEEKKSIFEKYSRILLIKNEEEFLKQMADIPDINMEDDEYNNLLMYYVYHLDPFYLLHVPGVKRSLRRIKYLVEKGININTQNIYDETIVSIAAKCHYPELFRYILTLNCDLSLNDEIKINIIFSQACHLDDLEILKVIYYSVNYPSVTTTNDKHKDVINIDYRSDFDRSTPLMDMLDGKHIKIANYLLDLGANCNMRDAEKNSVLVHAFRSGNKKIILRILLKLFHVKYLHQLPHLKSFYELYGEVDLIENFKEYSDNDEDNSDIEDDSDINIEYDIEMESHASSDIVVMYKKQLSKKELQNILFSAIESQSLEMVQFAFNFPIDVNLPKGDIYFSKKYNKYIIDNHHSALMEAVCGGNIEIVKYLISKGANIHYTSLMSYNYNCLTSAIIYTCLELVKYFLDLGVPVNDEDEDHNALRTAVDEAVRNTKTLEKEFEEKYNIKDQIVVLLLERGANPNKNTGSNYHYVTSSLLFPVCEHHMNYLLEELLKHGANVNYIDNEYGHIPSLRNDNVIRRCLNAENYEGLNLVLEYGFDINLLDEREKKLVHNYLSKNLNGKLFHKYNMLLNSQDDKYIISLKTIPYINMVNEEGNTLLMNYIEHYHPFYMGYVKDDEKYLKRTKFLVEMGTDINIRNKKSETVISICMYERSSLIFEYLVSQGVERNFDILTSHTLEQNNKIFNNIVQLGNFQLVKHLYNTAPCSNKFHFGKETNGSLIDINNSDHEGKTPLIITLLRCYVDKDTGNLTTKESMKLNNRFTSEQNTQSYTNIVKYLLDNGADCFMTDKDGISVLLHAFGSGNMEIIHLILSKVFGPDYMNVINTMTPLTEEFSISSGKKIKVGLSEIEKKNILNCVLHHEDMNLINFVLQFPIDINETNMWDETPLMTATTIGNIEIIKFLISIGANIHYELKSLRHYNCLTSAIISNKSNVVKFFLEKGLNPNSDNPNRNILRVAIEELAINTMYLKQTRNEETKQIYNNYCSEGKKIVSLLLKYGANPNKNTGPNLIYTRSSVLFTVCSFNLNDVFEELLSYGTDVNYFDENGDNVIRSCMKVKNYEGIKIALQKGFRVEKLNSKEKAFVEQYLKSN